MDAAKITADYTKYVHHLRTLHPDMQHETVCDHAMQVLSRKYGGDKRKFRAGLVKTGWSDPDYVLILKEQQEQDDFALCPYSVVDGVSKCRKCKSFKTYNVERQSRSCDEPSTVTTVCMQCGARSRYSG